MLECGEGAYTGMLSGTIPGYRLSNRMASFAKQNLENDRKQVCIRARRLMKLAGEV